MKILILGLGKTGTTALLYKLAAGLPDCRAFSGGKPGSVFHAIKTSIPNYIGDYKNVVFKHTYEERKGKDFDRFREHLKKERYDRKVWIARDPRDAAVSRMLYRWHRGNTGHQQQYQAHVDQVLKKEQDPRSIPFYEVCRYTGYDDWPVAKEKVIDEERTRYKKMCNFVEGLGDDWFLFTFEDMVGRNYAGLNRYLGFKVQEETEVPESTGKAKVIRKKASGDWRHWFTEEDVACFKSAYLPYMELTGYDCSDWTVSLDPVIAPEYSSMYMQSLLARVAWGTASKFKDRALRLFTKKAG